ncbi:MAG: hypothetical protein AAF216_06150 [Pseudomonadota bacterium]
MQPPPNDQLIEPRVASAEIPISAPVQMTLAELQRIIEADSIRQLARFADAQPGFRSNLGDDNTFRHWDLMRRTGFNPTAQLQAVLEEPYGTGKINGVTWYYWPYLAAYSSGRISTERITPVERADIVRLIGVTGLASLDGTKTYPGVRTAISEDGTWHYFLHEPE